MNNLEITISWEYFLGIIATLIGIAWYTGSKFSKIETAVEWMRGVINEIKRDMDTMKLDIILIKADILGIKADIVGIRSGVDVIQADVEKLKTNIK